MRSFFLIVYYLIASKLPNSAFPMGSLFNRFRVSIVRKILDIGYGCKIQKNVYFGNGMNVQIGNSCQINDNVRLDNVILGNDVMIGRDCIVLGKMHNTKSIEVPMIKQGEISVKQTIIEDNVWIGSRVIIMPGVKLRKGCIVGAGAVVTKNTNCNAVYGGIPAKLIKTRT